MFSDAAAYYFPVPFYLLIRQPVIDSLNIKIVSEFPVSFFI